MRTAYKIRNSYRQICHAIVILEEALKADPDNFEIRRALTMLIEAKEFEEQAERVRGVYKPLNWILGTIMNWRKK